MNPVYAKPGEMQRPLAVKKPTRTSPKKSTGEKKKNPAKNRRGKTSSLYWDQRCNHAGELKVVSATFDLWRAGKKKLIQRKGSKFKSVLQG